MHNIWQNKKLLYNYIKGTPGKYFVKLQVIHLSFMGKLRGKHEQTWKIVRKPDKYEYLL